MNGSFVHTVFFWLKEPESTEARSAFEAALTKFIAGTPGIVSSHIGTPADTDRPVIDSSYTYNLMVTFHSKADHDAYQEHPLHKEFIDTASPLWEKVQVYDSEKV